MSASSVSFRESNKSENATNILPITGEPSRQILISEKEYLALKNEIGYWKSLHKKAVVREKELKQKVKEQDGQIRDLKNRVFGKKSEKKRCVRDKCKREPESVKRSRGQQPGSQGHGRTQRPDLPKREEKVGFPEEPVCPCCGLPYIEDGYEQEEIIEVEVKAHTRVIKRHRRKKGCKCKGIPNKLTAPEPLKLFPKSFYGISIWVEALLTKFHYSQPTKSFSELLFRCWLHHFSWNYCRRFKKTEEVVPACLRCALQLSNAGR